MLGDWGHPLMDLADILAYASEIARGVGGGGGLDRGRQALADIQPWVSRMVTQAVPRWLAEAAQTTQCAVPEMRRGAYVGPCVLSGVASCDVCGRSVCLNHARVDQFGDAICYLCVAEAVQRSGRTWTDARDRKPAPSPSEVAQACAVLEVDESADLDAIKTAHRKQSAKWHPDKHRTPAAKAKAEARFKAVQHAFDVLQRHRSES